jgi:formate C-acetyltransferase
MKTTRKTFLGGITAVAATEWSGFAHAANVSGAPSRPARKQRGYADTTWWDPYVENITDTDTYLRRKFRQDVTDKTTGIGTQAIKKRLTEIVAAGKASGEPWRITKAKCFAAQALEMSIDVSPLDWFPAISIWNRNDRPIYSARGGRGGEMNAKLPAWVRKEWHEGNREGAWNMWQDFDHSVPDWRVILPLGFPGMKKRLEKYFVAGDPFYEGLKIAMDAMMAGLDRFIAQGKKNLAVAVNCDPPEGGGTRGRAAIHCGRLQKEIACLERLRNGPPQTAYDMMMFVWLYFFWSEHLDGFQCRSLTELDVFLTPYYDADIAAGRTTEAEFREHLKHFLWQWGSISNYWNQPVGLGGTNADGTSAFNHVSKIILEVMDACNLTTPKFLVKIAPNTPEWVMDKMMDMARRHRSLSFTGEVPLSNALKKWQGASDDDCRKAVMTGCYEFQLHDGANQTGVGHVNFLKPIEKMLVEAVGGNGRDARCPSATGKMPVVPVLWSQSFNSFKAEYLRRLAATTTRCREIAFEFEKVLGDVNPADLMTIATEHALKTRKDGFMNGCPRGNSSAILAVGPGTAVDALLAIKEIVYEKKEMSLAELGKVMAENWKGHEPLRLRMLRSKRKWGNNDQEANALGAELIDCYAAQLNGKPNSRGGIFLASGHCARQFIDLGRRTGATPDGRRKGDEMSKNLSPTMGVDTEGATALVATLAASDSTKLPGDYPLDLMLHPSVCAGKKGLDVMKALVRQFHANGGSVIQFTVFSAEELRDAQAHPERYENLQVRVCGWNVRWNDLSKAEQDTYICRAENVMRGY